MQRYAEIKNSIEQFNQLIFGCGFYFWWAYDHRRSMRTNKAENAKGKTLTIYAMFDPIYQIPDAEIYFKHCTEHDLPKDFSIPDHWTKPPFEIIDIQFATIENDENNNLVQQATFRLNCAIAHSDLDYYTIKAAGFYFKKLS